MNKTQNIVIVCLCLFDICGTFNNNFTTVCVVLNIEHDAIFKK